MKKTLLMAIAALSCAAMLQGCAGNSFISSIGKYETGVFVSPETMAALKDKKSTRADVVAKVGEPNRKAEVSGREIWYFDYTKLTSFAGNVSESAVFEFDKRGVLSAHYKTNKGSGQSDNALLKAAGQ